MAEAVQESFDGTAYWEMAGAGSEKGVAVWGSSRSGTPLNLARTSCLALRLRVIIINNNNNNNNNTILRADLNI
jgi:hypothetical protein